MTTRVLLTLGVVLAAAGAAGAQSLPVLDHFLCYFAASAPQQVQVVLRDQFALPGQPGETVTDLRIVRFCNPVQKTLPNGHTTPIGHPLDHLTLFEMTPQPILPRQVWIKNQFGTQRLAVRDAQLLAVPTSKASPPSAPLPPIPTDLDHYQCYSASGRGIGTVVTLQDQFAPARARVLEPISFCNPVEKTRTITTAAGGTITTVTPITHPDAHLTCYTITPIPFQAPIQIDNQFGTAPLVVVQADMLCVPSVKLRWAAVLPPSPASPAHPE